MRRFLFGSVQLPRFVLLLLVALPPVTVGVFAKLNPQEMIDFGPSEQDWAALPAVGTVPPQDLATSLSGQPIHLTNYRGRYVLLDFWTTWCPPCINDIPDLKELYAKYHAQGFEIIGVACNDKKEGSRVNKLIERKGIPWPQIYDAGDGTLDLKEAYGVSFYPTMIFIGPDGKVISQDAHGEVLVQLLEEAYPAESDTP